ncbi:MAG: phage/plasmid primase, P4 family [Verrucomicrobia bacterium]|nr:phage/plasmid primase, P4 family [Verrucomicrobiota bacterium]
MSVFDDLDETMDGRLPFSEDDLADRFSTEYADRLKFCHDWGKWLEWTGTFWQIDRTTKVYDMAREICRQAAAQCNQGSGKQLASARTIAAVERLARSDRRHATIADQWDADPFALNTPGGVVDLRTGAMRANQPEDHCTKITAVAPDGDCPLWREFMARISGENMELTTFLQKAMGYALTGSIREHALFFGHGQGANGKSTFLNCIADIMADYHTTAPAEVFMVSRNDRHPTELAGLQGARFVTAIETEGNRSWAEAKIKALTGGDEIAARFMRGDFFTFRPAFKLFVAGNHKPRLRNVDEAIRRRLHLIPFTVTIPPEERDPDLPDKLREEWPGILSWCIEGAVEWHRNGLRPPAIVANATQEYLNAEDTIALWIDDRCYAEDDARTLASELYKSFGDWAEAGGERAMSQRAFSTALEQHGYAKEKSRDGRYFLGLRV